jgi:hypothetical protein
MLQQLPTGIQSFVKLRENNYLYVDKTELICRLVSQERPFFFSRPRRFGKSLLLSTMEAVFKGQKDLFKGLWIENNYDWNKNYPVIKLDWTVIRHKTPGEARAHITNILRRIAGPYKLDLQEQGIALFEELIAKLHEKTGQKVAVLVDEYDVPILDKLENLNKESEPIEPIRDFMREFYRALKNADEHLHFVFITGITKFSKVSIFSAINNLIDISLDKEYSVLCGWTQEELESNFDKHLEQMAAELNCTKKDILHGIRGWYNGFSWDGVHTVYNPFSTLLLFEHKQFNNYWFGSGSPQFLINILKERNDVLSLLKPVKLSSASFDKFDYRTLHTGLLLFQSGYLTVKQIEYGEIGEPPVFTLGIPNNEVKNSLMEYLVSAYTEYPVETTFNIREQMRAAMLASNAADFEMSARELFARIPYQLHIPAEAYYHSLILLWLTMLGFDVQGEVSTNNGRIDAVWLYKEQAVIAEVKFAREGDAAALLDDAFKQIYEKKYYERYMGAYKVSLMAIGFTGKDTACKIIAKE